MDTIIYIDNIKIKANSINVTIYDSYKISNDDIDQFVIDARTELYNHGLKYERSCISWMKEIYAHNILYKLHLWEIFTKDTDLIEIEEWYRLFFFNVIYIIYFLFYLSKEFCYSIIKSLSKIYNKLIKK